MAQEHRSERSPLAPGDAGGWLVRVSKEGHLELVVPQTKEEAHPSLPSMVAAAAAEPVSAQEEALVVANREKIAALKTRRYGYGAELPLEDLVHACVAHAAPGFGLAAVGWILRTAGLLPFPILGAAAVVSEAAVRAVTARLGDGAHVHRVPEAATATAQDLWRAHPMWVMSTVILVLQATIEAATTDDTALEDQLDAFYPRRSQTDFEFDLSRRMPRPHGRSAT